jgi:NifB/MoaA-like Fe-S oxidoreductase
VPHASYYDDWPLTENGVGSVRALLDAFDAGLPRLSRMDGRRVAIVTGTRMGEVMAPLAARLAAQTGAMVELIPVVNRLFGPTVTTAGLLPGADLRDAVLERGGPFDLVLIPGESLNDDDIFIDDLPLATLRAALDGARVLPAHELIAALVAAQAVVQAA